MTHEGSNRNKRISTPNHNDDESERGRRKRSKKIRLICSNPYATDSSSDELQIGPKRIVREILLPHKNPIQIEQLLFSASDKPKNQSIVSYELNNDSSTESPSSSVVKTENSNDGCEIVNGGLMMGQFWNMNFGLDCGSVIIDNHGFLLGEFSRLDDLRIEKDNQDQLVR